MVMTRGWSGLPRPWLCCTTSCRSQVPHVHVCQVTSTTGTPPLNVVRHQGGRAPPQPRRRPPAFAITRRSRSTPRRANFKGSNTTGGLDGQAVQGRRGRGGFRSASSTGSTPDGPQRPACTSCRRACRYVCPPPPVCTPPFGPRAGVEREQDCGATGGSDLNRWILAMECWISMSTWPAAAAAAAGQRRSRR